MTFRFFKASNMHADLKGRPLCWHNGWPSCRVTREVVGSEPTKLEGKDFVNILETTVKK